VLSGNVYVIAVKREQRDTVPADWKQIVRDTPGVSVMGDASPFRLQVRASPDAIAVIRDRCSAYLHVEELNLHYPS